MESFLLWLSAKLPAREIRGDDGAAYMERYYLCTLFGVRCYLHRFLASDPDRGLHNHPWDWSRSLILSGHYFEVRKGSCKRFTPGMTNRIGPNDFHRIILPKDVSTWTLFCHGERIQGWGFMRGKIFTAFTDYPPGDGRWWKTAPNGKQLRSQK